MEDKKYYYGFHMHTFFEEEYYNSREEALKEANLKNCDNKLYIYTAEVSTYDGYKEDLATYLLHHITEMARYRIGEKSYDWMEEVSKVQEELLTEKIVRVLEDWMKETNNRPNFFGNVKSIERHHAEVNWSWGISD